MKKWKMDIKSEVEGAGISANCPNCGELLDPYFAHYHEITFEVDGVEHDGGEAEIFCQKCGWESFLGVSPDDDISNTDNMIMLLNEINKHGDKFDGEYIILK